MNTTRLVESSGTSDDSGVTKSAPTMHSAPLKNPGKRDNAWLATRPPPDMPPT